MASYLFAGPSLTPAARAEVRALKIVLRPPAVRGDIARLVSTKRPSVLILADGRFHQAMSVGHAELRRAVELGWQVWGLSSIGAIRAFELRGHGVRGYGDVYKIFLRSSDFQDDEVALLHSPDPPYRPGSEPLIHMRVALKAFARDGLIPSEGAREVISALKALWYGERTLDLFEDLTSARTAARNRHKLRDEIGCFDRFRIKQKDLTAFLATRSLS